MSTRSAYIASYSQHTRADHLIHQIAIHTWSHRYSTALTNEQMFAELWYTRKAIKEVIGVTPTSWRAPFGDIDDRVRFIAHKLGLTTVLWDHVGSGTSSRAQAANLIEGMLL